MLKTSIGFRAWDCTEYGKAYKATGKRKYMDFLIGWANRHIDETKDAVTINSSAPMLTIAELYHETGNEQYLNACLEAAEYIVGKAPYRFCGGLEHTVTEDVPAFRQQIWADTLFMAVLFVAKTGKYTKNQSYTDFAVNQQIHQISERRQRIVLPWLQLYNRKSFKRVFAGAGQMPDNIFHLRDIRIAE